LSHNESAPRVPGLDFLRSLAILWVMFFHMRFLPEPALARSLGRSGWMGVDLFFVLSGYLIGLQLLRPYSRGEAPSIPGFYFGVHFVSCQRI
jgi:peptidoglycan/LPS O-acetylase OafA/YrhL